MSSENLKQAGKKVSHIKILKMGQHNACSMSTLDWMKQAAIYHIFIGKKQITNLITPTQSDANKKNNDPEHNEIFFHFRFLN